MDILGIFKKRKPSPKSNESADEQGTKPGEGAIPGLGEIREAWLFNAPFFIDDVLIKSLYNAEALPQFEQGSVTISTKDIKVSKWAAEGQVEVSAGESVFSKLFFPISAKATVKGSRGGEKISWVRQGVDIHSRGCPRRTSHQLGIPLRSEPEGWGVECTRPRGPQQVAARPDPWEECTEAAYLSRCWERTPSHADVCGVVRWASGHLLRQARGRCRCRRGWRTSPTEISNDRPRCRGKQVLVLAAG
jgi:hypothetical protein